MVGWGFFSFRETCVLVLVWVGVSQDEESGSSSTLGMPRTVWSGIVRQLLQIECDTGQRHTELQCCFFVIGLT